MAPNRRAVVRYGTDPRRNACDKDSESAEDNGFNDTAKAKPNVCRRDLRWRLSHLAQELPEQLHRMDRLSRGSMQNLLTT